MPALPSLGDAEVNAPADDEAVAPQEVNGAL
jgi:hypothetical protein